MLKLAIGLALIAGIWLAFRRGAPRHLGRRWVERRLGGYCHDAVEVDSRLPHTEGPRAERVAVIGAGPCGLPACKTLDEFGIDYECLEARPEIGGIWNVEHGPGGGYRSLHTNTPTGGMAFSDFPFDEASPVYPSAEEMLRYFRAYAERFGLNERIRFGHAVRRARPIEGGGWRVELEAGGTREYEALVIATGQYNSPRRPHASIISTAQAGVSRS